MLWRAGILAHKRLRSMCVGKIDLEGRDTLLIYQSHTSFHCFILLSLSFLSVLQIFSPSVFLLLRWILPCSMRSASLAVCSRRDIEAFSIFDDRRDVGERNNVPKIPDQNYCHSMCRFCSLKSELSLMSVSVNQTEAALASTLHEWKL